MYFVREWWWCETKFRQEIRAKGASLVRVRRGLGAKGVRRVRGCALFVVRVLRRGSRCSRVVHKVAVSLREESGSCECSCAIDLGLCESRRDCANQQGWCGCPCATSEALRGCCARVWCGVPVARVLLPASFSGIIFVLNLVYQFISLFLYLLFFVIT